MPIPTKIFSESTMEENLSPKEGYEVGKRVRLKLPGETEWRRGHVL
eukprot:CAMPEP_0183311588 /NCGR_PEP_ID=MMETSP0160_2-20130417/37837_1 /TAXON_ID=2839 ORGANISM="Odontella Sinensis, Strain Grunow 1884" /NCGR_SAMPLE_ID=MMETSP0160_2 /ASSEMBLY_ACC=CAM_ASM_000250 /LENGTH=45 /DNA_ID= /DNA_START= /DNA_END= /DNA_ORIENTATION=